LCSSQHLGDLVAGVELSKSTDELDRRLGFGDAIGGMVMLAIAAACRNWRLRFPRQSRATSAWRLET